MCRRWTCQLVFASAAPLILGADGGAHQVNERAPAESKNAGPSSPAYSLTIDPEDEFLRSGAAYTLSLDGQQIWSGRRPYTLRYYVVTDRGWVAGVAYSTAARRPPGGGKRKLFFHVVILDADGREILDDVTERVPGPPLAVGVSQRVPYARQIMADHGNDRVIVRGQDDNTPGDARLGFWWVYRLSTGELLKKFRPTTSRSKMMDPVRKVFQTAFVRGTPLVLTHWFIPGGGARFTLVNLDGREVWRLDMDEDYVSLGLGSTRELHAYLARHPSILEPDKPGRFSIRSFAEDQRITFSVAPSGGDGWTVKEVARTQYTAPAQKGTAAQRG